MHFSDSQQLADLVVLDPQWLADVFKQLITVPPFDELDPQQAEWWSSVTKTGLLRPELVKHIWSGPDIRKCRSTLLAIMAQFDLVCPIRTRYRADTDSRAQGCLSKGLLMSEAARLAYDDPDDVASGGTQEKPATASTGAAGSNRCETLTVPVEPRLKFSRSSSIQVTNAPLDTSFTPAAASVSYMVPSLLRKEPPKTTLDTRHVNDPAPLCLVSAIGFLPEAFYYRLVARFVTRYPVCPDLYRRFARLHISKEFDLLIFYNTFWVKLAVQSTNANADKDAAKRQRLKNCCSQLIRTALQDASEVRRQGMRGLVFSLATCVELEDGKEGVAYLTNTTCSQHASPLPACAEYTCQDCIVPRDEKECVQLPANLPLIDVGGANGVCDAKENTIPIPDCLDYWFPSTAILSSPVRHDMNVSVYFSLHWPFLSLALETCRCFQIRN